MKNRQSEICLCIIIVVLFIVILLMGGNVDRLTDDNKQLRMEASRNVLVIDSLETLCRLQIEETKLWEEKHHEVHRKMLEWMASTASWEAEYKDLEARAAEFGKVACEQVMDLMNEIKQLKEMLRGSGIPPIPGITEEDDELLEPLDKPKCGR